MSQTILSNPTARPSCPPAVPLQAATVSAMHFFSQRIFENLRKVRGVQCGTGGDSQAIKRIPLCRGGTATAHISTARGIGMVHNCVGMFLGISTGVARALTRTLAGTSAPTCSRTRRPMDRCWICKVNSFSGDELFDTRGLEDPKTRFRVNH